MRLRRSQINISAEEKDRYLREAEAVLAREGVLTDRTNTGGLCILLDGAPLCEVLESGGVTYRMADVSTPERITAKDKVYGIVRAVAEYMYQMERAPVLKVDGFEDCDKVLADFNSVVLAGCPSKYGTQFVTWDRDFDHIRSCPYLLSALVLHGNQIQSSSYKIR